MSENNEVQEPTAEEIEQAAVQAEADFDSGFTGIEPASPVEDDKAADQEGAIKDEPTADQQDTATGDEEPKDDKTDDQATGDKPAATPVELTPAQIQNLLAKAARVDDLEAKLESTTDKVFGYYGELQRSMKELQDKKAPTAAVAGAKVAADQLKRLSEYDPEVAEMLAADLSDILGSGAAPTDMTEQVAEMVATSQNALRREMQAELLLDLRPDWETEVAADEFALFRSQMSPEDREEFDTSINARAINKHFKAFDKWKEASVSKQEEAERTAAEEARIAAEAREANKTNRLEKAIVPRGTTTEHTPSDNDAFEAGFNGTG